MHFTDFGLPTCPRDPKFCPSVFHPRLRSLSAHFVGLQDTNRCCDHLIADRTTRSRETAAARLVALLRKSSRSWGLVDPLEFRTRIDCLPSGRDRGRILATRKSENHADIRTPSRLLLSLHQPLLRARVRIVHSPHHSRCHTRSGLRPTAHCGLSARGQELARDVDRMDCGTCHHLLGLACSSIVRTGDE